MAQRPTFLRAAACVLAALLLLAAAPPTEHPFLLFDAADVPAFRAAMNGTHREISDEIVGFADRNLGSAPAPSPASNDIYMDYGNNIPPFAFAYLLTGDARYAALARTWILGVCEYPHWGTNIKTDNDLPAAHLLLGVSFGYDWIYDTLSPADRTLIESKLALQANLLYTAATGSQPEWWVKQLGSNHNWVDFAALGITGMLLQGQAPDADNWQAAAHANFGAVLDLLAEVGDGSSSEGVHYGSYGARRLLLYLHLLRRHTGENRFDHRWIRNFARWRLYTTEPDAFFQLPIADSYFWLTNPLEISRQLAAEYRDGHAEWLTRQWLPHVAGTPIRAHAAPFEFVFYDPTVTPVPPDDLPPSTLFEDWGVAVLKSGWGPNAVAISFKSGAPGGRARFTHAVASGNPEEMSPGHNHPDQNSFTLFAYGEPLSIDTAYVMPKWTADHNALLVDGKGQVGEGTRWFNSAHPEVLRSDGRITAFATLPHLDLVEGEAANTYPDVLSLRRATRTLLFVKPDYFVTVDTVSADWPHSYEAVLHNYGGGYWDFGEGWVLSRCKNVVLWTWVGQSGDKTITAGKVKGPVNWQYPNGMPGNWYTMRVKPKQKSRDANLVMAHFPIGPGGAFPEMEMKTEGSVVRVQAIHDSSKEVLVFARDGQPWTIEQLRSDAPVGVVRRAGTELLLAALFGGTHLDSSQDGAWQPLIMLADGARGTVEAEYEGATLNVAFQPAAATLAPVHLTLYAPAATAVTLNGVPAPFTRDGDIVTLTWAGPAGVAGPPQ